MKTKIQINKLVSKFFIAILTAFLAVNFVSAQYQYQNQNQNQYYYNQPVGVTSFDGNYSNYGYNNDSYNNYSYQNDNSYYGNNYNNYNYNNNYSYQTLSPATYAATNVSSNSGTINGYVTLSGNNSYNNYNNYGTAWFEYGTNYNYLNSTTNPANVYNSTSINAYLTNLSCGQTYYFRAVTGGPQGTQYGATLSFTARPCYNNYYSNNFQNYTYKKRIPRNIPTNCVKKGIIGRK